MKRLTDGVKVCTSGDSYAVDGTRRYRVPICAATGARDIAQSLSIYSLGVANATTNQTAEEVLFVLRGCGACHLDGRRYAIEEGTAVFVAPGVVCQIENERDADLEIVSVRCPDEEQMRVSSDVSVPPESRPRPVVHESNCKSIRTGDRSFKLLANQELGAQRVTQFLGVIPPGRAPMHHHTYEEAIYIIEGEGRIWTKSDSCEFAAGSSIYLPRGVSHSLENTGVANIKLLGVFHPSGSPAVSYQE